jgi:glycosyltransferase involved in cell wall biosynthesis
MQQITLSSSNPNSTGSDYTGGQHVVQRNYQVFRNLLTTVEQLVKNEQYGAAAVYGQMAASFAQSNHCGLFASYELEQLLLNIGCQAVAPRVISHPPAIANNIPQKILHVSSIAPECGGIPRLMRRWIQQDSLRSHSVALTKHAPTKVPQALIEAVRQRQGNVYLLNQQPGGLLARAKRLRECARSVDLIVLHSWEHDVVPLLAFADRNQCPPIIYTNHGDHWFWVGAAISDIVANLRESGMKLSEQRRGIEPRRNMLLPTILDAPTRHLTRPEAKQQLGIPEDTVLLLSIARAVKYKTADGPNFAEAHVALLNQHPKAILIVVGPGGLEDWSDAIQQTQGRIRVLPETPDTAIFYQAADIYVDSYPFVSITSLLEAGSYGVPLVSRHPQQSESCAVLGADMPGLTDNLILATSLEDYHQLLSKLIIDPDYRLRLGEITQAKITAMHWGSHWQKQLEHVYAQAGQLPRVSPRPNATDPISLAEVDILLPSIHKTNLSQVLHWHLSLLPLPERLKLWLNLCKADGFSATPSNLLLPDWLRSRYQFLRYG